MNGIRPYLLPIVLLISLSANLFTLSLWLSRPAAQPATPPFTPTQSQPMGNRAMHQAWLHSEQLRPVWQKREASIRQHMQSLHTAQQQVRQLLQAETWEANRLEQALAELRLQMTAAQTEWHQLLLESAALLPAPQRAQLAMPALRFGMGRGMGRHAPERAP
ncbi:MAG: periplasmic heavy metal sensor [Magnetococcales bacterium]|nr:periplasmic heavy metal sensor [Magnetococcales bacterium]